MKRCTCSEVVAAVSMLPGIYLALSWGSTLPYPVSIIAYCWVIDCLGGYIYHLRCSMDPDLSHPTYLKIDLMSHLVTISMAMVLSHNGVPGLLSIAPLIVLFLMCDLADETQAVIAVAAGGISTMLTNYMVLNSPKHLMWTSLAFVIYSMKSWKPEWYLQIQLIWHILCHTNMRQFWIQWAAHLYKDICTQQ